MLMAGFYGITVAVGVSLHLSYICQSLFLFLDDNLSKCQWIFTKLGICIAIVKIWFGVANGQILSIFDRVTCQRHSNFSFPDDNLRKNQWLFTKLGLCIDIVEIWFRIANGQTSHFLTKLSAHDISGVSFPDNKFSK